MRVAELQRCARYELFTTAVCLHEMFIGEYGSLTAHSAVGHQGVGTQHLYRASHRHEHGASLQLSLSAPV